MLDSTDKRKLDSLSSTSKPCKRPRKRTFYYDKLPDRHSRILQVTSELKRNGRRSFTTHLRSFPVSSLPHFVALSYAWPKPGSPVQTIKCNGQAIAISAHVHTAFESLCPAGSASSFAIWVDAICIDQENDIEKNKQVSHMGSVHGLATQVIVWLGLNKLVRQYRHEIESLARRRDYLQSLEQERLHGWQNFSFSGLEAALSEVIYSFLASPWFRRLWIVQEVCLGRLVSVLCDACTVPWDFLRIIFGWRTDVMFSELSPTGSYAGSRCGHAITEARETMETYQESETLPPNPDFTYMIGTLVSLRLQMVSKPIDKVFGLMFILPENIRDQIVVDYSQEKMFWKTYVCLTRILLGQQGGLDTLNLALSKYRESTLPSWCPDWNTPVDRVPESMNRRYPSPGSGGSRRHLPKVRFGDNLRHLKVRGFRIDQIVHSILVPIAKLNAFYENETWCVWQGHCLNTIHALLGDDKDVDEKLRMHMSNLVAGSRLLGSSYDGPPDDLTGSD